MILKIKKVTRNEFEEIQSETVLDKHAVITDLLNDKAEVLLTDRVEIRGLLWVPDEGVFRMHLTFGGVDASGKFHPNLKYQSLLISWSRDQYPQYWTQFNLDSIDGINLEQMKQWIHDAMVGETGDNFVQFACRNALNMPDIESRIEDSAGRVLSGYKRRPRPRPATPAP